MLSKFLKCSLTPIRFPSTLCAKTDEIKIHCKSVQELVMDVVTDAQGCTSNVRISKYIWQATSVHVI